MELGSVSYFSPFLFLFLSHLCMGLSVEFSLSVDLLCRGGAGQVDQVDQTDHL